MSNLIRKRVPEPELIAANSKSVASMTAALRSIAVKICRRESWNEL
ncbi:MAG TPA: hypothetical protein VFS47_09950 [Steroidobacteraceae bacterium]|nr:hypothetical protein [Steroidobacteraceae bacterium]